MAKRMAHYLKNGKKHLGGSHRMANGNLHTGLKHTSASQRLYHFAELPSAAAKKTARKKS